MSDIVTLDGSVVSLDNEAETVKIKKVDLFGFLTAIGESKEYIFSEETASAFVPFMVNKGFSQHMDTIMFANEMNKNYFGTKEMVHDFLYHSISKKKRYGKWAKQESNDDVELLMKHYNINRKHAIQYLKLLTREQIDSIKQQYETGGRKK